MDNDRIGRWLAGMVFAGLAGCAARPAPAPASSDNTPADFPAAYYEGLAAQGRPVLRLDPERSLVLMEVRRGGSLAQFGHDHVVASHDTRGFVALDQGRADLYVRVDALVVDEPALRAGAGFDTQPSTADIEGTRRNMLDKVLEADRYPFVQVAVRGVQETAGEQRVRAAVTLHGTTRMIDAVVQLVHAEADFSVTGSMAIDQSDFGMAPFSIFGGAVAVQNRVTIKFRLHAKPIGSSPL